MLHSRGNFLISISINIRILSHKTLSKLLYRWSIIFCFKNLIFTFCSSLFFFLLKEVWILFDQYNYRESLNSITRCEEGFWKIIVKIDIAFFIFILFHEKKYGSHVLQRSKKIDLLLFSQESFSVKYRLLKVFL